MSTFGELLRADRERLQLSQEQLAKMLDVSQQAVANWEAGAAMPRRERRARLLQILGPTSELVRNPPRSEFIPAQDQPVSHMPSSLVPQTTTPDPMTPTPQPSRTQSFNVPKGADTFRPHVELNRLRAEQDRRDFVDALPVPLHEYMDGRITVGATTRRISYLSPRWAIEIRRVSNPIFTMQTAAAALLNLAVIRGISDQGLRPPREHVLIFVNDRVMPVSHLGMQRVMFDAGVLGVRVYQVESFTQAAELVAQLETDGEDVSDETDRPDPDHPESGAWS